MFGYIWFMKAARTKHSNTAWATRIPCVSQNNSRTLWWYSNKARIDGLNAYSAQLEGVNTSFTWNFVEFSIHFGRKESDKARQAVFFTPLNPFGNDPDQEKPHQKVHYQIYWKHNQDAVYWIKLSIAQDQGLQFWQTKSFVIITYATVPGDCIDRVISQNGHGVIFERLATPMPAPQVMVNSNWHTQQQQQQQP